MYCLDTDIVIGFLRGHSDAVSKLTNLQESKTDIAITPLTLCELYRGAFLSKENDKNVALINNFVGKITLLNHDQVSCQIFGENYVYLKRKGQQTQEMDLMIASICKANNCVLITRNIKDFKNVPGLLLEKW